MATRSARSEFAFDANGLPSGFDVFADQAACDAAIQQAEDDLAAGRVHSHEEVVAEFKAYITEMQAR